MLIDFLLRSVASVFVLWFLVIFVLLIHETGHMLVLAYYKLKVDKVIVGNIKIFTLTVGGIRHEFGIFPLFAFTISQDYAKAPHPTRVAVALAGPITSVLLGLLLLLFDQFVPGWFTKLSANASITLGFWNLIPFPPMDGWPVLEWALFKNNVVIGEKRRNFLLGVGIICIAVLAVLI